MEKSYEIVLTQRHPFFGRLILLFQEKCLFCYRLGQRLHIVFRQNGFAFCGR